MSFVKDIFLRFTWNLLKVRSIPVFLGFWNSPKIQKHSEYAIIDLNPLSFWAIPITIKDWDNSGIGEFGRLLKWLWLVRGIIDLEDFQEYLILMPGDISKTEVNFWFLISNRFNIQYPFPEFPRILKIPISKIQKIQYFGPSSKLISMI